MKKIIIIFLLIQQFCYAQVKAWETDAAPLHRAQKALTDIIIHDIFSPPVAGRIYAYTNIAAYEVLVKQNEGYHSLYKQLNSFPEIPFPSIHVSTSTRWLSVPPEIMRQPFFVSSSARTFAFFFMWAA